MKESVCRIHEHRTNLYTLQLFGSIFCCIYRKTLGKLFCYSWVDSIIVKAKNIWYNEHDFKWYGLSARKELAP